MNLIMYNTTAISNIMAALVLVFVSSCTKLDFYPHTSVAPETVSERDMDALLNGMYNAVQNNQGRESYIMFDLVGGNLIGGSGGSELPFIRNIMRTDYNLVNNNWSGLYRSLYQVNNVLEIMATLPESDKRVRIEGTAHFFRAYVYYNLVTRWGDVPLILENTTERVSRDLSSAVWSQIETDIAIAMEKTPVFEDDYYYVSQQAAKALLARVLIGQNKMAEAAQIAEELIGTQTFSLDRFDKIFRHQDNNEEIFSFKNLTEESNITLSTLFYTYAHDVSGSYVYKPTEAVMNLFEEEDNRRDMSIATVSSLNVINKYPSGQTGTDPIPIIRLAEMYLIAAEAKGLAGLPLLNELRAARNLPAINPSNESEYQEAVALERRRELLAEGFRWFDLVRTGKAVEELGIEDYRTKFPIPDYEREVNPNLTQNEGY
ncbi:RagB/SusD family nutrient uptake outer membrane protein [Olivibacter sp. SDN3]|uniref:RagB/SusD family nutrient uptake outer membrane protein n=1 Tax=Olivibacter sp. SDN3 TaxID=2764720 RepID=UPI00165175EE|nr:RagB/SusD family nutrient uptake outer membrane protein [Olivibacter sp. SDN3]QNL48073.1 RagB/SusD family nutrient uptake outer membrane protein [Olivibacter sp. SDN3]